MCLVCLFLLYVLAAKCVLINSVKISVGISLVYIVKNTICVEKCVLVLNGKKSKNNNTPSLRSVIFIIHQNVNIFLKNKIYFMSLKLLKQFYHCTKYDKMYVCVSV